MAESLAGTSTMPLDRPLTVPPMNVHQEDTVILARITNDEKALRKVTKKFHTYTSIAYDPVVPPSPGTPTSADDARDAFLVELASFHLSLKKNLMACEAEARQVEEYHRERERIEQEQALLKEEIEDLKTALEQAQVERKRKIEYDAIAEKINAFPSREELEQSIQALENDMAAIHAEQDNQNRTLQSQKSKLDGVIADLHELRLMGKPEQDGPDSGGGLTVPVADRGETEEPSRAVTPANPDAPSSSSADIEMADASATNANASTEVEEEEGETGETGELVEEKEEREKGEETDDEVPLSKSSASLNPDALPFAPRLSTTPQKSTPASSQRPDTPPDDGKEEGEEEEDIEMGEVEEPQRSGSGRKKVKTEPEELEEGEASDLSSELSEPPDD